MTFLHLIRTRYCFDGIFGQIKDGSGTRLAFTLEHAYLSDLGIYNPKIPSGQYVCVKGVHRLESMKNDFTTFEVTGVENHSNLLFHMGNFQTDSRGCILLGRSIQEFKGHLMVTSSDETFIAFMSRLAGVSEFTLDVR